MKCPNCGSNIRRPSEVCLSCGFNVGAPMTDEQAELQLSTSRLSAKHLLNALVLLVLVLISVSFFGLLVYNGYFWFDSWRLNRIYASGEMRAPDVEEIEMDDGRLGHAFTFYGRDGDKLFIPELGKSYMFVGGLTRIEIADGDWFDLSPENEEAAVVSMMPVIYTEGNGRVSLPELSVTIPTPTSPLKLVDPPTEYTTVYTSIYPMEIWVVPGSKVLINGEDRSDFVNYDGVLMSHINVDPIGENHISINVETPHHRQTRQDIVLYRARQSINLEYDLNQEKSTSKSTVTIKGTTEPGAMIVVDSKYVEGSLKVSGSGAYSFQAKLSIIGDNTVNWHATMPGREDTYMSLTIYYVPTLNEYSRKAWKMDYPQLTKMTDTWDKRIFLCAGPVVEIVQEASGTEPQLIAMDVAAEGEEPQYVILENLSNVGTPVVGQKYRAYADVNGTYFYENKRCPKLVVRYMLDSDS